jgi:hypothetical protein
MSVPAEYLADSPVSYWRLGEPSGTEAADVKAANNGTYKGTPTLGAAGLLLADPSTAATLNGTTQYVSVPDSASLDLGDVFTYEAWIKRSGTGKTDCIIDKGANAAVFRFDGEDHLLLRRNSVGDIAKSTTKITDTNAHHLVATKNGATAKIYIDGVDVTGAVTNQTCTNTAIALGIGASDAGTEDFFRGTIDEAAVYGTALSAARVLAHYEAGTRRRRLGVI